MFRKLWQVETEAVLRMCGEQQERQDPDEANLLTFAGMLAHCVPALPHRFGVCASRFDS